MPFGRQDSQSDAAFNPQNFLEEERQADRLALHRTLMRWVLSFAGIFCFAALAFWWSGSAVRYSAARVQNRSNPTYQVTGSVTDSRTRRPVAWAELSTDFQFGGAFFSTTADQEGQYALSTLPEPHDLVVKANGYRPARIHVGKQWFSWMPRGSEREDVQLTPER